jgi:hypothetical protein
MVNFVNWGIDILPKLGIDINNLIFRTNFTQVYYHFEKSDEANADKRS